MGQIFKVLNKEREKQQSKSYSSSETDKKNKIVIFLGTGSSGKSTLLKQLLLYYGQDLEGKAFTSKKDEIISSFIFRFDGFIRAIKIHFGAKAEEKDLLDKVEKYFPHNFSRIENFNNPEFLSVVKAVWESDFGRETWVKRENFGLSDSLEYFCENLERLLSEDYIPTEKDYLLTQTFTIGVKLNNVNYKGVDLLVVDVGGLQNERKNWFYVYEKISVIFYVVSLACFDEYLFEDNRKERLEDSIEFFTKTVNAKIFETVPFVLFLNKEDILEQKVRVLVENGRDLDEVFPGIGLGLGNNYEKCDEKVKEYLKQKVLERVKIEKLPLIYPHFITATNKDSFLTVFEMVFMEIQPFL